MSNTLAIAAVTATLQGLIEREGILVSTQSLDRAAQETSGQSRVNLFLYHTMPDPNWRNMQIPQQTRSGELGHPPLAINLHYLLTAYGSDGSELTAHHVLGKAMRALHDWPVLKRDDIRNFTQSSQDLRESDLDQQVEKVRITPDPLSLEDLSRLWTTFQTQYRVSASYQASVVLIESRRETRSPLPVLRRRFDDSGVHVQLMGLDPELERIEYRASPDGPKFPAAEIERPPESPPGPPVRNQVLVGGKNFPQHDVSLIIRDAKKEQASDGGDRIAKLPVTRLSDTELALTLPRLDPADDALIPWASGLLSLELQFPKSNPPAVPPDETDAERHTHRTTNALPLAVAPTLRMRNDGEKVLIGRATENGKAMLDVSCEFPVGDRRRVYLILSGDTTSYQLPQARDEIGTGQLQPRFDISNVQPGLYWLRLRADGVDSLVMKEAPTENSVDLVFDDRYQIQL